MKKYSIIVILLILFAFQNCKGSQAENIFLITLDTTRADFIDYSKNNNSTTPNLAKLANNGFYFSNSYSVIPITLPSHASMLYSQYPHNIGILNNGDINRENHLSLPQILKHNGFSTGAVISLGVLKSDFGLNRGFDIYIDSFKRFIWTKSAKDVNLEIEKLIKKKKKGRNFFWIHYSDPHEPYLPYYSKGTFSLILNNFNNKPEIIELKFLYTMHIDNDSKIELYKKSIEYMDGEIGKFLSFLKREGELEKSVFVIMGDHGEGLGEYLNNFGHIHYLNKLYTRVPFIVSGFGISSEGERTDLVSNLNIDPTILKLCGLKKPGFMEGESVLKRIKKNKLIVETFSPEAYFDAYSLIEFPYQIIFYPGRREKRIEFTNLNIDPLGILGISDRKIEKIRDKMLKSILAISRTIIATKGKPGKKKRVHREILRSLGYL